MKQSRRVVASHSPPSDSESDGRWRWKHGPSGRFKFNNLILGVSKEKRERRRFAEEIAGRRKSDRRRKAF